ncbi:MAG: cation transporter, partial [Methanobacteriota archaeon]
MFPPWKAAASLLSNRGFMLQAVLIAVLLGVHTAIAAACLPLLGALRFSLLDAADLVVMAAVTYATMRASHAHLPRAIVLAVLGLCFICAYRPGAASEADAAAASPLMDIGSVDAAGVDGGLPPVPELVSRKLTAVAPLPPRVPRTRADANAQRDANADVDADADADALPSQVVQHEEDAQVPVPAPILQPSLAPAVPGVDTASKLQPIAKRGRRAAALAAARGVRNALRGTSWFSVALAASLLVFATWLSGVRRRLVRSLAAASKSHTMHISALTAIIASVLWLPLALVRVMWGDGSAASSPTVGGEDAMSAGAAMNAEVSSLRVLLAAVLFGAVVLGFTDVARDAPILQTGGISGATSGAAALHSHSTGASAVARNAAMKAVDSFLIRLILCASPMLLALVLPSLFGPTLLHSSELTIALWLGAFLCYLPALPLLAGVNVEWLLSRMARSLQSAAAAADSQGRASAPHRLLAYLFAALHAALMHLANVMRAAGLTGVPGEVSVGGMAGGGGAGMGGLLPLTLADGKALFSGFASGGGGDAASSLAGAHGSRASQLLGCNPVTVRRIIRHIMEDSSSRRIAAFLAINFSFMFVEVFVGWMTNSLGLLSDAGHMFFDNASLVIGLYASYMARWQPDSYFPYGYARYETLAGLVNAIFLVFVAVSVVAEGLERLWEPPAISGAQLLPVAIAGLCVNGIGLIFFHDAAHGHSHGGGGGRAQHHGKK